jgi:hypothetical protein
MRVILPLTRSRVLPHLIVGAVFILRAETSTGEFPMRLLVKSGAAEDVGNTEKSSCPWTDVGLFLVDTPEKKLMVLQKVG